MKDIDADAISFDAMRDLLRPTAPIRGRHARGIYTKLWAPPQSDVALISAVTRPWVKMLIVELALQTASRGNLQLVMNRSSVRFLQTARQTAPPDLRECQFPLNDRDFCGSFPEQSPPEPGSGVLCMQ
jgi:hypothetical protein